MPTPNKPRAKAPASTGAQAAKATARTDAPGDPNQLSRQAAGSYRTADERFEVRQTGTGWFIVDASATDELGQPLMRGPFPTLDAATQMLPEARRETFKPIR